MKRYSEAAIKKTFLMKFRSASTTAHGQSGRASSDSDYDANGNGSDAFCICRRSHSTSLGRCTFHYASYPGDALAFYNRPGMPPPTPIQ